MIELIASLPAVSFKFTDIVVFVLIILGAYRGYQKGFLVELISSLSFFIVLAIMFWLLHMGFDFTKVKLGGLAKSAPFFTFVLVFFTLVVAVNFLGRRLKDVISYTIFEGFDNFLGLLVGLLKYTYAIAILFALCTYVGLITPGGDMAKTYFYPLLMDLFDKTLSILGSVMPFMQQLKGNIRAIMK